MIRQVVHKPTTMHAFEFLGDDSITPEFKRYFPDHRCIPMRSGNQRLDLRLGSSVNPIIYQGQWVIFTVSNDKLLGVTPEIHAIEILTQAECYRKYDFIC